MASPIDPPDTERPPKWAWALVGAAKTRNRARWPVIPEAVFSMADLIASWERCGGYCAVSGLPFGFQVVGNGQARRPFAPSLDRIDPDKPYQRDNVRLVVSIANFAMNAWGEEPLLQLASAIHRKRGDRPPPSAKQGPADSDLAEIASIDAEFVETDIGTLPFPPRPDMHEPLLDLLRNGKRCSDELEDSLAAQFGITTEMRRALLRSGCPAWRNHVAWALVDLVKHQGGKGGKGQIERCGNKGSRGIYCLTGEEPEKPRPP